MTNTTASHNISPMHKTRTQFFPSLPRYTNNALGSDDATTSASSIESNLGQLPDPRVCCTTKICKACHTSISSVNCAPRSPTKAVLRRLEAHPAGPVGAFYPLSLLCTVHTQDKLHDHFPCDMKDASQLGGQAHVPTFAPYIMCSQPV